MQKIIKLIVKMKKNEKKSEKKSVWPDHPIPFFANVYKKEGLTHPLTSEFFSPFFTWQDP